MQMCRATSLIPHVKITGDHMMSPVWPLKFGPSFLTFLTTHLVWIMAERLLRLAQWRSPESWLEILLPSGGWYYVLNVLLSVWCHGGWTLKINSHCSLLLVAFVKMDNTLVYSSKEVDSWLPSSSTGTLRPFPPSRFKVGVCCGSTSSHIDNLSMIRKPGCSITMLL